MIDNTAEAVLATGPGDTAIRFDGVALPPSTTLTDYIQSGWVGGLDASTIRPFRIGDLEAVSAQAVGGSYVFNVTVIRVGGQVYRFLTALPPTRPPACRRSRAASPVPSASCGRKSANS